MLAALLGLVAARPAAAVFIDFEGFTVGDNLATVNTALSPLGATLDAIQPSTFAVAVDPNDATNQILRTQTLPAGADILINFSAPVGFISVRYVDNPDAGGGPFMIVLTARDFTGTASSVQGQPSIGGASGFEPDTLKIVAPGIRSVQIESGSGFMYVDDFQYRFQVFVPEPASLAVFAVGLLGLGFLRRRRRKTTPLS